MRALLSRTAAWLFDAVGSESIARIILLTLAVSFGLAGLFQDARTVSWSVAATFLVATCLSYVRRWWEYRHESYSIVRRENSFLLKDDGRTVIYQVVLKIRSSQRNLRSCAVRFRWSGETNIVNEQPVYEAVGNGFTIVPERTKQFDDFKFDFDEPLRHFRTKTVGIRFTLSEPNRAYSPFIGMDPSPWAWSPLSRLVTRIAWEDQGLIDLDKVWAAAYRSGWDRHRRSTGSMRRWEAGDLSRPSDQTYCREWIVTPVRHDRYYYLEFGFARKPSSTPAATS